MCLSDEKTEKISHIVIGVLFSRFESFPGDILNNRNAPFHEAFLNAFSDVIKEKVSDIPFFISMSSWLHGLNTTLGQTFFEKTAHVLSDGEKREYTSKKLGNLNLSGIQKNNINEIITNLSIGKNLPNLQIENNILLKADNSNATSALDFSADVFIETDNEVVAIELKSVRPNSGEMRGEKHKILEGKCALFNKYPDKKVSFFLGFPFDPTSDTPTGYNKKRFMESVINLKKYFDESEILLAGELWDYLAGSEKTMEALLKIINNISTPEFLDRYKCLNDISNIEPDKYAEYIEKWNLFSQLDLIKNDEKIKEAISGSGQLSRIYNQQVFQDGRYNYNRYEKLIELI